MRKSMHNRHYFTSEEIELLDRIQKDIRTVVKVNKLNEAPHPRLLEWACWLKILHNKHIKRGEMETHA